MLVNALVMCGLQALSEWTGEKRVPQVHPPLNGCLLPRSLHPPTSKWFSLLQIFIDGRYVGEYDDVVDESDKENGKKLQTKVQDQLATLGVASSTASRCLTCTAVSS